MGGVRLEKCFKVASERERAEKMAIKIGRKTEGEWSMAIEAEVGHVTTELFQEEGVAQNTEMKWPNVYGPDIDFEALLETGPELQRAYRSQPPTSDR